MMVDKFGVAHALARLSRALDREPDIADITADLVETCQKLLKADATGIMLRARGGRLQLLTASTHRSAELELHQSQIDEGPCVDAATHGHSVVVTGEESLRATWPVFGPAMLETGFWAVHSAPLRWNGSPIGAMALFRRDGVPFDDEEDSAAQSFADLAAHIIMGAEQGPSALHERVVAALASRVVVEQAKGVIAQETECEMGDAYTRLRSLASERSRTLTAMANDLVSQAAGGAVDLS